MNIFDHHLVMWINFIFHGARTPMVLRAKEERLKKYNALSEEVKSQYTTDFLNNTSDIETLAEVS